MSLIKFGSDGRSMGPVVPVTLAAFLDEKTGLMWAAMDVSEKSLNFADAEKAVANFRAAGFSDWRLPTIDELETLRDRTRFKPAANPELELKSECYWSSTPDASAPGECAWIVNFNDGHSHIYLRHDRAFVRAVRSARASQ